MAGRASFHGQELLFLAAVLLSYTLRGADSECVTSSVSGISIREFNFTTRSAVNSSKGMSSLFEWDVSCKHCTN